jgi:hypothetical protein
VRFAEDETVIQTVAPDRTDQALGERIGQSKRLRTVQTIRAEAFGLPIRFTP